MIVEQNNGQLTMHFKTKSGWETWRIGEKNVLNLLRTMETADKTYAILDIEAQPDRTEEEVNALINKRYFLSGDGDGHDYAVPVTKRKEWSAWTELDREDPTSWEVPEYAIQVESDLTFTDPQND